MRSLVVVESYNTLYLGFAFLSVGNSHSVEPLRLEDAVGTLGHGVFQRVAALCHAYLYSSAFECVHVGVAAVLAP